MIAQLICRAHTPVDVLLTNYWKKEVYVKVDSTDHKIGISKSTKYSILVKYRYISK